MSWKQRMETDKRMDSARYPFIRWYPLLNCDIKYRMGEELATDESEATDGNG